MEAEFKRLKNQNMELQNKIKSYSREIVKNESKENGTGAAGGAANKDATTLITEEIQKYKEKANKQILRYKDNYVKLEYEVKNLKTMLNKKVRLVG